MRFPFGLGCASFLGFACCGGFGVAASASPDGSSDVATAAEGGGAVDGGAGESGPLDGSTEAGCGGSGRAALDPAFGSGGSLVLPMSSVRLASGSAGELVAAGLERCGDGGAAHLALRRIPTSGSGPGALVRCFEDGDGEFLVGFEGDAATGYALVSNLQSGTSLVARLRRLDGQLRERAPKVDVLPSGGAEYATFASRTSELDLWGGYTNATAGGPKNAFLRVEGGPSASLPAGEIPIAGASAGAGKLAVAFVRIVDASSPTPLVVRRYLVSNSTFAVDATFGTGGAVEVPLTAHVEPTVLFAGQGPGGAMFADEARVTVLLPVGPSVTAYRAEGASLRALGQVSSYGGGLAAPKCDGSFLLGYLDRDSRSVRVVRYAASGQKDPGFDLDLGFASAPSAVFGHDDRSTYVVSPGGSGTSVAKRVVP